MPLKRNILAGKNKFNLFYFILFIYLLLFNLSFAKKNTEGVFTDLKILDKISSKKFINSDFNVSWLDNDTII